MGKIRNVVGKKRSIHILLIPSAYETREKVAEFLGVTKAEVDDMAYTRLFEAFNRELELLEAVG